MKKVLIVGSINMDYVLGVNHFPQNGETILCNNFSLNCGGKGANQACTCAKLGMETIILGVVGNDDNGDMLLISLEGAGANMIFRNTMFLFLYSTCTNCFLSRNSPSEIKNPLDYIDVK